MRRSRTFVVHVPNSQSKSCWPLDWAVGACVAADGAGETVNPPSLFLRFPDRPNARIITLPAHLGGDDAVTGMKWVASFPDNIVQGIPRASAVLLLNHPDTGYPFACVEGSIISAARTAASAALGAFWLNGRRKTVDCLGIIGTGLIARYIFEFMIGAGWQIGRLMIFDARRDYAERFKENTDSHHYPEVDIAESAEALIKASGMTVFATTAATPYITDQRAFDHNPKLLHISLRDLAPEIILRSDNIVDDIDHCLTANTSPHLAERQSGGRAFITGTLHDLMTGKVEPRGDRPVILTPFGMGILDVAVGKYVFDRAVATDRHIPVDDFFYERTR